MQHCAVFRAPRLSVLRSRPHPRALHARSEAAQVASAPVGAVASEQHARLFRLRFGVKNIPHPNKAHYGGEDAYFVSEMGGGSMGIADGVGGWQESGVNPAEYSRTFMAAACQYLEECATLQPPPPPPAEEAVEEAGEELGGSDAAGVAAAPSTPPPPPPPLPEPRTAVEALDIAHRATRVPGSATACVLRLDARTAELDAANLGDSGFLIIRDGQLHFQSPAMQHFFDCPLQFGMPPDTDWAEDAAVFTFQLQEGDAIVLATDGLLDNLRPEDIVRLAPRSAAEVEQAAAAMAELAAQNAADPTYESPYSQEALEEGYDIPLWEKVLSSRFKDGKFELGKLRGGKMDDITVLCAYVAPTEVEEA